MESTTLTEVPDLELVARVCQGEQALYAELIRRHHSRLRTVLSFYIHSQEELEEFLQASFVQAYIHLESCSLSSGFFPWLKGIALNTLKMELRRLHATRKKAGDYVRYVRLQRLENDPDGAQAEARAAALRGCLEKLPDEDRSLLKSKYGDNLPVKTLAQTLHSTEGALKVRLLRIRNLLRACIYKHVALAEDA